MRRVARVVLVLLVPGALLVVGGLAVVAFMRVRAATATGDPRLDQFRSRVALGAVWYWRTVDSALATRVARAFMAILHQEMLPDWDGRAPVLGDKAIASGPSVGPGQVLRQTAVDLGLVPSTETPEAYSARAADVDWAIDAALQVFRSKYAQAGGDLAQAIQLYNGSGPKAEDYRYAALSFAASTWGDGSVAPADAGGSEA